MQGQPGTDCVRHIQQRHRAGFLKPFGVHRPLYYVMGAGCGNKRLSISLLCCGFGPIPPFHVLSPPFGLELSILCLFPLLYLGSTQLLEFYRISQLFSLHLKDLDFWTMLKELFGPPNDELHKRILYWEVGVSLWGPRPNARVWM